jgi:predicted nucleic acid-binding protein
MPNIIVIADTSCLIAFSKLQAFELLRNMYKKVFITQEIAAVADLSIS